MKKLLLLLILFSFNTSMAGIDTPEADRIKIKFSGKNLKNQDGRHFQVWLKKRGFMVPVIRLNVTSDGKFYRASKNGGFMIEKYSDTESISIANILKGSIENYLYNARLFITLEPDNDFNLGGEFDVSTVIMIGVLKSPVDGYSSQRYVAKTVWSPIYEEFLDAEFHLLIK